MYESNLNPIENECNDTSNMGTETMVLWAILPFVLLRSIRIWTACTLAVDFVPVSKRSRFASHRIV